MSHQEIVNRVKLLNTPETAELLGIRPNTLEIWRIKGIGPAYRKIGRAVRYAESDVLAWLDAQTHSSTCEYATRINHNLAAV